MEEAIQDYQDFIDFVRSVAPDSPVIPRAMEMANSFQEYCSAFTATEVQPMQRSFPRNGNLYAIGDIHSDYCTFVVCLKLARVLDESFTSDTPIQYARWTGGESLVVQVGDLIGGECHSCDCEYSRTAEHHKAECISWLRIMQLIVELNKQAHMIGDGGIVTLYGNHEMRHVLAYNELITSNSPVRLRSQLPPDADIKRSQKKQCKYDERACPFFKYSDDGEYDEWEQLTHPPKVLKHVHENEVKESGDLGYESHQRLFQPGGLMSDYLGCASLPVLIVGDWIFVHGGVVDRFLNHAIFQDIPDPRKRIIFYNMLVRDYVLKEDKEAFYFLSKGDRELYFHDMVEETDEDRTDMTSPIWNNRYGVKLKNDCSGLDDVLDRLQIGHMVVGHVPQIPKKISSRQLAKPNKHEKYREKALQNDSSSTSLNACVTDHGNKLFRIDAAMGFRNCKNRAQLLKIESNGTISYVANQSPNRKDLGKFKPVEKIIFQ